MARKYYVVWSGRQTGIFEDWATTHRAVDKYPGARFKSFATRAEAERHFASGGSPTVPCQTAATEKAAIPAKDRRLSHIPHQFDVSIYCDGACDPNPGNAGSGVVVYRDGELSELWFGLYDPRGTNNT